MFICTAKSPNLKTHALHLDASVWSCSWDRYTHVSKNTQTPPPAPPPPPYTDIQTQTLDSDARCCYKGALRGTCSLYLPGSYSQVMINALHAHRWICIPPLLLINDTEGLVLRRHAQTFESTVCMNLSYRPTGVRLTCRTILFIPHTECIHCIGPTIFINLTTIDTKYVLVLQY